MRPLRGSGEAYRIYTSPPAGFRPRNAHYPGWGYLSCPYPTPQLWNSSVASTGLHPSSTINSATYSTKRSIRNACRTLKVMIWYGLLTIWTMYVPRCPSPRSPLKPRRLSMISIPLVPLPGSVCGNLELYAGLGGYYQHHTRIRFTFSTLIPSRSPQEDMVTCITGSSTVQGFASNVCACIPAMVHKRLLKCILMLSLSPSRNR